MKKHICPFTDFGFEYIFGQEDTKEFLIDFLNVLLGSEPNFEPIEDVTFLPNRAGVPRSAARGVISDIKCHTASGRQFVVEIQNGQQGYYIDRSIYYGARSVASQGSSSERWNYFLTPVYVVALINFNMEALGDNVRSDVALCDLKTHKPVSDKIHFIYIQLKKFDKKEKDCVGRFCQWLYNLKNMDRMEELAFTEENPLFKRLSEMTAVENLTVEERNEYDADLNNYRDLTNCINFAEETGRLKERDQTIRKLRSRGWSETEIREFLKE